MKESEIYNRSPDIRKNFFEHGFFLHEKPFSRQEVDALKKALHHAIAQEAPLRRDSDDPSQVVCCPLYDDLFLDILRRDIFMSANELLGKDCIIYNYGNSSIRPGVGNFSSHIHVERPYSTGNHLEGIGVMILLDDFTVENGATWFLPGSWLLEQAPNQTEFFAKAERLLAPAGSILYFHPHLWHSGGINRTALTREALTIGFCRPYLKQRLDLPSLFATRREELTADVVQKLGFHSQPPRDIESFYQRSRGWLSIDTPAQDTTSS